METKLSINLVNQVKSMYKLQSCSYTRNLKITAQYLSLLSNAEIETLIWLKYKRQLVLALNKH